MGLINVVLEHIGPYKICVDQGFPRSGDMFDKFVGPMSQRTRDNLAPAMRQMLLQRHNMYVSLRQNFRTHYVGLNQISTVFNPLYEQYVNIDNYDRIARYYDNNY